jgi:Mn2+/Fe2+ NRAMP family transporter
VVNGVLLPFLLIFMMIIINDRRIMGRHVNGTVYNVLGWATVTIVIALTVALLGMQAFGVT